MTKGERAGVNPSRKKAASRVTEFMNGPLFEAEYFAISNSAAEYFRYEAYCSLIMPKGMPLVDLKQQGNGGRLIQPVDELPEA